MTAVTTVLEPTERAAAPRGVWTRLVVAVVGLPIVATLMLLAFAAPSLHSGAHDLPLAVAGPDAAVARLTAALDRQRPGAFDVTTHADADAVTTAVQDRDAIGGLVVGADGVDVVVASGAGTPYAPLLRALGTALAATGTTVTYTDVAPFAADDQTGSGIASLALPLVFGGMATAMMMVVFVRGRLLMRLGAASVVAVLAGIATTAVLQFGFHAIDGDFWFTAGGVAGGMAAISLFDLGMESLFGYAGLGVGAVIMLFVANPLSGMATGPAWLPHPWGEIGQFLPVGAAGWVIRSAAYFDGRAATRAWLVLFAWMVLGVLLAWVAARRRAARRTAARRQSGEPEPAVG